MQRPAPPCSLSCPHRPCHYLSANIATDRKLSRSPSWKGARAPTAAVQRMPPEMNCPPPRPTSYSTLRSWKTGPVSVRPSSTHSSARRPKRKERGVRVLLMTEPSLVLPLARTRVIPPSVARPSPAHRRCNRAHQLLPCCAIGNHGPLNNHRQGVAPAAHPRQDPPRAVHPPPGLRSADNAAAPVSVRARVQRALRPDAQKALLKAVDPSTPAQQRVCYQGRPGPRFNARAPPLLKGVSSFLAGIRHVIPPVCIEGKDHYHATTIVITRPPLLLDDEQQDAP